MWQNFYAKRGTQQQKTVGMETLNTFYMKNNNSYTAHFVPGFPCL
jgi:hypothetical protein